MKTILIALRRWLSGGPEPVGDGGPEHALEAARRSALLHP
jgi:hypothetical protein